MTKIEKLDRIFVDQPRLHEIAETGKFRAERSSLPVGQRDWLASLTARQNWGISRDFGRYLLDVVKPGMRTLETGAGVSTLIFALGGANHIAIAPWNSEMEAIHRYASGIGVDMSRVDCVVAKSQDWLPTFSDELNLVFIDGMHAFPWPILDWYYTADRLKLGGLMMLDDTQLQSVGILSEFLKADTPRWKLIKTVGRTDIFEKIAQGIYDVAWHEQPWTTFVPRKMFGIRTISAFRRYFW